jgi:hypothetical protein
LRIGFKRHFYFFLQSLLCAQLLCPQAQSYPMFFKCEADGSVQDMLQPAEIRASLVQLVRSKSDEEIQRMLREMCAGLEECTRQLGQVLTLVDSSKDVAQKILDRQLKNAKSEGDGPFKQITAETYELARGLIEVSEALNACRGEGCSLDPSKFVNGEGKLLLYYPRNSNYLYPTGIRGIGDAKYQPPEAESYREGIRLALRMGADPYLALALGLMEMGANGVKGLYLDPIGKFKAMECQASGTIGLASGMKAGKRPQPKGLLVSYGNLHRISEGVVRDPRLASRLQSVVEAKVKASRDFPGQCGQDSKELSALTQSKDQPCAPAVAPPLEIRQASAYYCRQTSSEAGAFQSEPRAGSCCLQLGFIPNQMSEFEVSKELERAMAFEHVRQVQMRPSLNGKSDPAYRVQAFNGFSTLMGGAEHVPSWRAGINFFETPTYGYQAMEYILNTLMTNPAIRKMVEEESQKLKTRAPSILCAGKSAGFYSTDSEEYFRRHVEAPRLVQVRRKFEQGLSYARLTSRERAVMKIEFDTPAVRKELEKAGLKLPNFHERRAEIHEKDLSLAQKYAEIDQLRKREQIESESFYSQAMSIYFKNIYARRDTVQEAALYNGRVITEIDGSDWIPRPGEMGRKPYTWGNLTEFDLKVIRNHFSETTAQRAERLSHSGYIVHGGGGFGVMGKTGGLKVISKLEKTDGAEASPPKEAIPPQSLHDAWSQLPSLISFPIYSGMPK